MIRALPLALTLALTLGACSAVTAPEACAWPDDADPQGVDLCTPADPARANPECPWWRPRPLGLERANPDATSECARTAEPGFDSKSACFAACGEVRL